MSHGCEPCVQKDGTLANGAFALREAYLAIRKGGPTIAQLGGTERAKVFLAEMPGRGEVRLALAEPQAVRINWQTDYEITVLVLRGIEKQKAWRSHAAASRCQGSASRNIRLLPSFWYPRSR